MIKRYIFSENEIKDQSVFDVEQRKVGISIFFRSWSSVGGLDYSFIRISKHKN